MASLVLAARALAQPTTQPKQQAGDLTKRAIAKSQAGDHQAAIELYLQAYDIVPLAMLLSNVGAEYQKLKKPADALKYFCMYLEKDPKGGTASFATTQAKLLRHDLGDDDVTDADVCQPRAKPVEPPKLPPPMTTPQPPPSPPATPPATPPAAPTPTVVDRGGTLRVTGLGLGVVGLIGLGVGGYFGWKAKDLADQITNHPIGDPWPSDIKQIEADGEAAERKQVIFLAAGGALAVTGTVLYFMGRSRRSERTVAVQPTATPDTLGLAISGGF
jgi:serine/threonine-protein kinase